MKRSLYIFLIALLLAGLCIGFIKGSSKIYASGTLDDSCTSFLGGTDTMSSTANSITAQKFVPATSADLDHITIKIKKTGTPSGNAFIKIYSDSSGLPGTLLYTSNNVAQSTITGTLTDTDFTFASGATLVSGTAYWYGVTNDNGVSSSNYNSVGTVTPSCHTDAKNWDGSNWNTISGSLGLYFQEYWAASATNTPTPTPTPAVADGWNSAGEAWTYASSTTITVPSDATTKYSPGDKIRLKQGGDYKYFYITNVTSTVLTVTGGSDYSVANATITDNSYSKANTPVGFPQWFNWSPTYSASGSMTYTSVTTDVAKFSITGRTVHIALQAQGTLGGTSSFGIRATAPVTPANDGFYTDGGAYIDEVGNHEFSGGVYPNNGELEFGVFGNFVTGHSTVIGTSYSYEF